VAGRESIADMMVGSAGVDGEVSPPEVKVLLSVFTMLGLEPHNASPRLHAAMASTTSGPLDADTILGVAPIVPTVTELSAVWSTSMGKASESATDKDVVTL